MIDVMVHRTLIALKSHVEESSLHRRKLGVCPVLVMMAFGKVRSRVTWFLGGLLFLESVGGNLFCLAGTSTGFRDETLYI